MRHGSLFSGIGGFDLAASWMGWENVFHCEWNEFGQKVLKYYWPDAISYGDITKTDFTIHRGRIDILTGGFPCQPFSVAGKRKGTEDDRHLWPEMLRAIREIQPQWIVGENVSGIISWDRGLVFEQVCADLEAEGYEVQPVILPAVSVNAPHRRDRVWFVAKNTNQNGWGGNEREKEPGVRKFRNSGTGNNEQLPTDNGKVRTSPDSNNSGARERLRINHDGEEENKGRKGQPQPEPWKIGSFTSDSQGVGMEGNRSIRQQKPQAQVRQGLSGRNGSGTDWSEWPTQSPICGRNDGLSSGLAGITVSKHRNESIKAYGNAIVPQVVFQIFKAISNQ